MSILFAVAIISNNIDGLGIINTQTCLHHAYDNESIRVAIVSKHRLRIFSYRVIAYIFTRATI